VAGWARKSGTRTWELREPGGSELGCTDGTAFNRDLSLELERVFELSGLRISKYMISLKISCFHRFLVRSAGFPGRGGGGGKYAD
jgi:hypothetical protein